MRKGLCSVIVIMILCACILPIAAFADSSESLQLPENIEADVKKLYKESVPGTSDLSNSEIYITYHGRYDGAYAMEITDGYGVYPGESLYVTIHGHCFVFYPPVEMFLYRDGELKQLSDAWAAGWLSPETLCSLWNYYTNGIQHVPNTNDAVLLPSIAFLFLSSIAIITCIVKKRRNYK